MIAASVQIESEPYTGKGAVKDFLAELRRRKVLRVAGVDGRRAFAGGA